MLVRVLLPRQQSLPLLPQEASQPHPQLQWMKGKRQCLLNVTCSWFYSMMGRSRRLQCSLPEWAGRDSLKALKMAAECRLCARALSHITAQRNNQTFLLPCQCKERQKDALPLPLSVRYQSVYGWTLAARKLRKTGSGWPFTDHCSFITCIPNRSEWFCKRFKNFFAALHCKVHLHFSCTVISKKNSVYNIEARLILVAYVSFYFRLTICLCPAWTRIRNCEHRWGSCIHIASILGITLLPVNGCSTSRLF